MEELERQRKTLNMMISMHAMLRDRNLFKAKFIDIFLFSSAALLNVLVFIDYNLLKKIWINKEGAQITIGVFSIIIFIISVITLIVKWKEKAENHERAVNLLSGLLNDCRFILELNEDKRKIYCEKFNKNYKEINESIIKIPENKFVILKSRHLRKIELSKLIEISPNKPYIFLKMSQFITGVFK